MDRFYSRLGSSTVYEWPDQYGGVAYDEAWPWTGRRPVAPRNGQSWHTISFTASRCDGIVDLSENSEIDTVSQIVSSRVVKRRLSRVNGLE